MLRTTLLLAAGLALLPVSTFAQVGYGSGTAAPATEMKKDMMTASLHSDWNDILQSYVSAPDKVGLTHFDYAGLKENAADSAKLSGYLKALGAVNPDTLSRDEAIVFYANLYNALTIDLIVQNYPLKSIRKAKIYNGKKISALSGPWKKTKTAVNGEMLSLDDIEHGILREKYPSPYIHYMVNCASVGCPNLLDEAWDVKTYEAKRLEAASAYINSPRGAVVNGDKLTVSSIYDWFEVDFGGNKAGVIAHLKDHATGELATALNNGASIKKYDYDWSLNK